jgi:transcriptional regulator NrdR family protein
MDNLSHDARLDLALSSLREQTEPNFMGTAKEFQVNRTTLRRRFQATQQSRRIARSESGQCLSLAQEEVLIGFINRLTDRSLPPTSRIVKNLAEELAKRPIRKNWVSQFTQRYKDRLHAGYMRTIDSKRVKADYIPNLIKFYDQVPYSILL